MKNQQEQIRERYSQVQSEFDFNQDDKMEKLKWIETVIFPLLEN